MLKVLNKQYLENKHTFNAGMIAVDKQGNYSYFMDENTDHVKMIYRSSPSQYGKSALYEIKLTPTFDQIPSEKGHKISEECREDPRLWTYNNNLYCSYTYYDGKIGKVKFASVNNHRLGPDVSIDLNTKGGWEKNWTFFDNGGKLACFYKTNPFEMYEVDMNTHTTKLIASHNWNPPKNVILRGGSIPVRIGDELYFFTHSRSYDVYVVVTDAITYKPLRVSAVPLIPKNGKKIFFPCNVLYSPQYQKFHISMGIDDLEVGVYTINKYVVDADLQAC